MNVVLNRVKLIITAYSQHLIAVRVLVSGQNDLTFFLVSQKKNNFAQYIVLKLFEYRCKVK